MRDLPIRKVRFSSCVSCIVYQVRLLFSQIPGIGRVNERLLDSIGVKVWPSVHVNTLLN